MKNKKRSILIISIAIIFLVAVAVITVPLIRNAVENSQIREYLSQDLKNVDNVVLISHCIEVDEKTNSIAGVKEAVRLGADAVIVDLCFRNDGTPVITDNYEERDSATTVEELFLEMNADKFKDTVIYLNIVQLSEMNKLNNIAVKHNMLSRTFLIGIDEEHYGLIDSDSTILPFLLDYKLTDEDNTAISDGTFSAPECIARYGASGIVIDAEQATEETVSTLNDFGIPFIVSGIDNTEEYCASLINGAAYVHVSDIEKSADILDEWTTSMQERHSSSVEQSLADLKKNI